MKFDCLPARMDSAARGVSEVSPEVARTPRSRMEVLRDLAPDVHDALLDLLAATFDPVRADTADECGKRAVHAAATLALIVHRASDGRGWRVLHAESVARRGIG